VGISAAVEVLGASEGNVVDIPTSLDVMLELESADFDVTTVSLEDDPIIALEELENPVSLVDVDPSLEVAEADDEVIPKSLDVVDA